MSDIHSKGSPTSQIWVIAEAPYPQDKDKGFIFSGGYGYMFDKMMREAGITDYYVTCRRPDLNDRSCFTIIENKLNQYKPPIIITLEEAGKILCPELNKKHSQAEDEEEAEIESDIQKYAGSLLTSSSLNYPHYIIPSFAPDTVVTDWSLRDIITSLDLGKAASEIEYYRKHGKLQPLPVRELKYELTFEELLYILEEKFMYSGL